MGKIAKWFSDLKALAFKNSVATGDITVSSVTNEKLANAPASTIKGNAGNTAAAPADLSAAQVRSLLNVEDGADVTGASLEATAQIDAIAPEDKVIVEDVSADAGQKTKHVLWSAIVTIFNAAYAPLSHAARHGSNGTDRITPHAIGAPVISGSLSATLPNTAASYTASGNGYTIELPIAGIALTGFDYVVSPAPASHKEYVRVGAYMLDPTVADNATFYVDSIPNAALTVNILKVEVE